MQLKIDYDALTGGSKYSAIPSVAPTDTQPPKGLCCVVERIISIEMTLKQLQEHVTKVKYRMPKMVIDLLDG